MWYWTTKWVIEEIKKEINETHGDRSKNTKIQDLWNAGKAVPRGVYRNTSLHQETKIPKALT